MAKPFGLWKRGKVYYYRLAGGTWRSTSCTRQDQAIEYAMDQVRQAREAAAERARRRETIPLRDYLEPFYKWGACPHITRLLTEKKRCSRQHAQHRRGLLDNYVLKDSIADMPIQDLRRGHILDFRQRLPEKHSPDLVNRIIGTLKMCLKEAVFREELEKDPTLGIGNIRHEPEERGIFTQEELRGLFPLKGLGPWGSLQAYPCFLIAATCGLRRGEVLALRWGDLDFDGQILHVRQAWKSDKELGDPKWSQARSVPLPVRTAQRLKELRTASSHVLPAALVFHNEDGRRKSTLWGREAFSGAMTRAKISSKARRLTPQQFPAHRGHPAAGRWSGRRTDPGGLGLEQSRDSGPVHPFWPRASSEAGGVNGQDPFVQLK
jgi:integrase